MATFLVFYYPIVVIVLYTSTLSRPEPLRSVMFSLHTVAPCIHRYRFCVSSACLHRYYGFIRLLITHCSGFPIQVIPQLPVSFRLNSVILKRVGCESNIKEDVIRPPSVTQESIHSHPCLITPVLIFLLNLPLSDGVSVHTKVTTGSLVFRAVAADIRELRTILRSTALPVFFAWEQTHTVGF